MSAVPRWLWLIQLWFLGSCVVSAFATASTKDFALHVVAVSGIAVRAVAEFGGQAAPGAFAFGLFTHGAKARERIVSDRDRGFWFRGHQTKSPTPVSRDRAKSAAGRTGYFVTAPQIIIS